MSFIGWLQSLRSAIARQLTTGDAYVALRNHCASIGLGFVLGALAAVLWVGFGLVASIAFGALIGYGLRSYVSHRRREAFRRRNGLF
ncbi:hypothetical protein [Bosea sp. AS-1]|uniref:hypothetical protein n=1 Tax=Bosea sp. AS-1 TaxID=2015316 RepID=UPI000B778E5B|nr:hypothetical protein [Bosea sp. AS-1]